MLYFFYAMQRSRGMLNTNSFNMFSIFHYNIIIYLVLFGCFFIMFAKRASQKEEKITRRILAFSLVFLYSAECALSIILGYYEFYEFFPMHLCSIMVILAPIALLSKKQIVFELVYLYGTFAAFCAILFPALFVQEYYDLRISLFMVKHGFIVIAPLYMIFVNGFRPSFNGVLKSIVIAISFCILVVLPLDFIFDFNYFYLIHGPSGTPLATIESALGYGGYAAVLCALAVFVPLILYLPFYITNKLHK